MVENVKKNANIYGEFTTPIVSNCECDDRHKVIIRIESNFAPMRHEDFYNSRNIIHSICKSYFVVYDYHFRVRLYYCPPIKYLFSHAFLKCSFKCKRCNFSGDFVVEFSDKGMEINFGFYRKTIFENTERLKNIQILYFHLLNIVGKLKRNGFRKKDYKKVSNNCWRFVQVLGDELERFIEN